MLVFDSNEFYSWIPILKIDTNWFWWLIQFGYECSIDTNVSVWFKWVLFMDMNVKDWYKC